MNKFFTILLLALFTISANAQCSLTFTPFEQYNDSVEIVGQGVDVTIYGDTTLTFNGSGAISFSYATTNGNGNSTFNYDCNGQVFSTSTLNANGLFHTENQPLPVEFTYFKVENINQSTVLTWQTASEENNSHFQVEHSMNGVDFEKIGIVNGNGTTLEVNDYIFIDRQPKSGVNYYRLKQIDFDGQFEYSSIVSVEFIGEISESRILGNISDSKIQIIGDGQCIIYNNIGQPVKMLQLTESNTTTVDISSLPKGIYYVRMERGTTLEFVKP